MKRFAGVVGSFLCLALLAGPAQAVTHKRACAVAKRAAAEWRDPSDRRWGVIWCRRVNAGTFRAKVYSAGVIRSSGKPGDDSQDLWMTCWDYAYISHDKFGEPEDRERYLGLWYGPSIDPRWDGDCDFGKRFPHEIDPGGET